MKSFIDFIEEQRIDEILAKVRGRSSPVRDSELREVIQDALKRAGVNAKSEDRLRNHAALALIFDGVIRFMVDRFKTFGVMQLGPGLTELIVDAVMDACPWARHQHVLQRSSYATKLIADFLRIHHGGQRVTPQQQ